MDRVLRQALRAHRLGICNDHIDCISVPNDGSTTGGVEVDPGKVVNCLAACVIESNDAFGETGAMACAGGTDANGIKGGS